MSDYLNKLAEIEKLIARMDLPSYRKTVKHNDDVRWLKFNLGTRNSKHKNYTAAMQIIDTLV